MIRYTSIRAALRFIPTSLYEHNNEADFLSWMLDGLRLLNLSSISCENAIDIFEIKNNKVILPKEIKEINLITYLANDPSKADLSSFSDCICNPESDNNGVDTNNICKYTLAYKLFLDSPYYNNNYAPLHFKGRYTDSILCSDCPNRFYSCENWFTLSKEGILHTNLTCGFLCIDYAKEILDEDGNYQIPDLTTLKQFLAYYAIAKQWENRAASKEQAADRYAQDALIKAEIFLNKVQGSTELRSIDRNAIAAMMGDSYMRFIKIPERYVYAR